MSRHVARILLLLLPVLAWGVSPASAHRAQVVGGGDGEGGTQVDLGREPSAQLIHATLEDSDDSLTVRFTVPDEDRFAVDVLVPDQRQERGVKPRIELIGASVSPDHHARGGRLTDRATQVRYRRLDRFTRADGLLPGRQVSIRVVRGAEPLRVAIRTDDGSAFRLEQATQVPRTIARIGGWAARPALGAPQVAEDSGEVFRGLVWLPFSFAGVVVLIAAWWMLRGRSAARRRGVERADDERAAGPSAE